MCAKSPPRASGCQGYPQSRWQPIDLNCFHTLLNAFKLGSYSLRSAPSPPSQPPHSHSGWALGLSLMAGVLFAPPRSTGVPTLPTRPTHRHPQTRQGRWWKGSPEGPLPISVWKPLGWSPSFRGLSVNTDDARAGPMVEAESECSALMGLPRLMGKGRRLVCGKGSE